MGEIAAVEVKAAVTLTQGDWRRLDRLRDACEAGFKAGPSMSERRPCR